VADAVGDELAHEQTDVLEDLGWKLAGESVECAAGVRGSLLVRSEPGLDP
jgi:hypothetical protein